MQYHTEQFLHPQSLPVYLLCSQYSPLLQSLATTNMFSISVVLLFPECFMNEIIQLGASGSGFFHSVKCVKDSSMYELIA